MPTRDAMRGWTNSAAFGLRESACKQMKKRNLKIVLVIIILSSEQLQNIFHGLGPLTSLDCALARNGDGLVPARALACKKAGDVHDDRPGGDKSDLVIVTHLFLRVVLDAVLQELRVILMKERRRTSK